MIRPLVLALVSTLVALAAGAATPDEERARIRAERDAAEARYAAAERECRTRFVVTSCVDAAQAERRDALAKLRAQEHVLDEAQRRQRAAERSAELEAKRRAAAEPASGAASAPGEADARPGAPSAPRGGDKVRDRRAREAPALPGAAERESNRARFEQKQRDAEAHRAEVTRRNAERDARRKKPVQPLPPPASDP